MSVPAEFDRFVRAFFKAQGCQVNGEADEVFAVVCSGEKSQEYTYETTLAREKKVPLLAPGSAAFQQILKECQQDGMFCQIVLKPKTDFEAILRSNYKDIPLNCQSCSMYQIGVCLKPERCAHIINNGKIVSVKTLKTEPARYFQFYFSITFNSRLRSKHEETIAVLVEEKTGTISDIAFCVDNFEHLGVTANDLKSKIKPDIFGSLRSAAEEKVRGTIAAKLKLFELPLCRAKKAKLRSFQKRLRKERREQVISKRHNFDYLKWQNDYEILLKREEESYSTNVSAKFANLLVVNTSKVKCQLTLDNGATIDTQFTIGIKPNVEIICQICKKTFTEGYATKDSLYVCPDCTRQSIETGEVYSKRARLSIDEKLGEYFESNAGFLCSVCGRKYSRLLEFICSYDGSSVCISHFDLCDECGKVFSKNNLAYTDEFKHQLCPNHNKKGES